MSQNKKLHLLFPTKDCSWYAIVNTCNACHAVEAQFVSDASDNPLLQDASLHDISGRSSAAVHDASMHNVSHSAMHTHFAVPKVLLTDLFVMPMCTAGPGAPPWTPPWVPTLVIRCSAAATSFPFVFLTFSCDPCGWHTCCCMAQPTYLPADHKTHHEGQSVQSKPFVSIKQL